MALDDVVKGPLGEMLGVYYEKCRTVGSNGENLIPIKMEWANDNKIMKCNTIYLTISFNVFEIL